MSEIYLNEEFSKLWNGKNPFHAAFELDGEEFRRVKSRRTFRFEIDGKGYFAKLHCGVGWREILKNLFQLKRPVLGAGNEYRACRHLDRIGVDTMTPCAYGSRGWNPAAQRSFLVTAELADTVSLEDYCREWGAMPPPFKEKSALIAQVGYMAGAMHRSGMNHRDCYICHFLLDKSTAGTHFPRLYIIDLHRAQIRPATPYRYQVKDTAGLYFSAMDAKLTWRDAMRFIAAYSARPLRKELKDNWKFWHDVEKTAIKLYQKVHGREPEQIVFLPLKPRKHHAKG